MEGKLSKICISEVCDAHLYQTSSPRINRYTRSSSEFQKGWWPLV